ncbi:MAG: sodium-translocating pyrophosphatase [Candidatus Thorarchaeota archaeon]
MGLFSTFLHLLWYEQVAILMVIVAAIISLIYAIWLRRDVLKHDKGTKKMQEVWTAIKDGATAYLRKQLRTILPIVAGLTIVLFLSVYIVPPSLEALEVFPPSEGFTYQQVQLIIATGRAIAFVMGALSSLAVGQLGMRIAIESNIRVASASGRSYREALKIAYHGGTFTGMLTDGLGLLGGTMIFIAFGISAPDALLGFGFGGTLLALFMRIGGGIYTKAADVGADLVGKVEAGLPEDDPRNAAVIADLVGDNVGDCAGMAADIFESYEVTIVSALILGVALYVVTNQIFWIIFPLVVRAIGVISSIIGTFMVAVWKTEKAEKAMFYSYEVSSAFTIIVSSIFAYFYTGDIRLGILVAVGVLLAVSFNPLTNYFTSHRHRPVEEIVEQAHGGPATIVLSGISTGYEAAVSILMVIVATFIAAFLIAPEYVLFGIALIGIGMLSHTGNNVAMDSYGPIADNAGGIAELTDMPSESRKILADLDAVGNTTKAITKNVAIASAVIAASALFYSFVVDVARAAAAAGIPNPLALGIRIDNPLVLSGLLLGAALPWLFSSLAIRAVSRASTQIIDEVREQFKIPGVMEGTVKPHYDRVVSITTAAAQKELISLTILSVITPIAIGLLLQVEALGGFLAGLIASGLLLAVYMSVAGGAWDNAKKFIEDEVCAPDQGTGKGSERHKAAVCGDTIGDPLKDTAGPALNPMIKVVNLISLIAAPILITYRFYNPGWPPIPTILLWDLIIGVVVIFLVGLLIWAFRRSRRSIPPIAQWESRE